MVRGMKLGTAVPIGIAMALAGWTVWGALASRAERVRYEVLKKSGRYEIRRYPPRLLARASVKGAADRAIGEGFRILARYISGANRMRGPMEAGPSADPAREPPAERIAMTAPVSVEETPDETYTVAFTMPPDYTRESLPEPTDERVRIAAEPARTLAVLRFGWPRTPARIKAREAELLACLAQDGIETVGRPRYAGYNPPWTPPWLVRNEVMAEIR